jgi:hypothetical protein
MARPTSARATAAPPTFSRTPPPLRYDAQDTLRFYDIIFSLALRRPVANQQTWNLLSKSDGVAINGGFIWLTEPVEHGSFHQFYDQFSYFEDGGVDGLEMVDVTLVDTITQATFNRKFRVWQDGANRFCVSVVE